ncbi:hypothetical protein ACNKHV_15145 [Shigella flexneri]
MEGYERILARRKMTAAMITRDVLPHCQFNLSRAFLICKCWNPCRSGWQHTLGDKKGPRFSVNLMPLTLLQRILPGGLFLLV